MQGIEFLRSSKPSDRLSSTSSYHIVRQPSHLCEVLLHPLKAQVIGSVDFINHDSLRHVSHELGSVKLIVGTGSFENLGLLLDGEIFVGVGWVDVLLVQVQDLIMGNDTWVGKVVNTSQSFLGHCQRRREHLMQYCHRVGDVDNSFILDNLGDKIAVEQIIRDRHAHTKDQAVGVALQQRLHVTLRLAVERSVKVGNVFLRETNARSQLVLFVVSKNASCRVDGDVNVTLIAKIGNVQGSNYIGANCLGFVVLAPINVGTSSDSGGHEYMRGLHFIKLLGQSFAIFDTSLGVDNLNA